MSGPAPEREAVVAEVLAKIDNANFDEPVVAMVYRERAAAALGALDAAPAQGCECPPCPGRGNDGHGMTHCAECCFGTGVEGDPGCPIHGERAAAPAQDGADPADGLSEDPRDHEPTMGSFSNMAGVVGCACMDTRAWYAYVTAHGGPGWLAWAEHLRAARQRPTQQAATDRVVEAVEALHLTVAEIDALNDAFVEANRAEFCDWAVEDELDPKDHDLPILRAIEHLLTERLIAAADAPPVVLDLDDPYFDGQMLPDALRGYAHVHSTTGVCVKNVQFCGAPRGGSDD